MRWDFKKRSKLALLVWEKSGLITSDIKASNLIDFRFQRDRLTLEYFEKVGFRRVYQWEMDRTPHHPRLFKASKTHLFFLVTTNHVMGVKKNVAEKILVLGLP